MPITPEMLGGDEDTARRVLVSARIIAPCLDSLPDNSDSQKDALAILRSIVTDTQGRGSRFVRSQGVGSASVSFDRAVSLFDVADRIGLQSLCGVVPSMSAPSKGSFPAPGIVSRMWPER